MNKITFLETLEKGLKSHQVQDITDIIDDYKEYFDRQIASGKKEKDVAFALGSIDSIVSEYANNQRGNHKKWFELVTISFVAVPMLIINYGLLIIFVASSLAFWGIAVYLAFDINTFSFMPTIPLIPTIFYVLTTLATCVFMFSLSVRFYGVLKSMTKQYLVKQSIRIGEYVQAPVYKTIFKVSLWAMIVLTMITYLISALVAKSFEYWHTWEWFR